MTTQIVLTAALGIARGALLPRHGRLRRVHGARRPVRRRAHRPSAVRADARRDPGRRARLALRGAEGLGGLPAELWSFPTSPGFGAWDILGMLVLIGLPHMVGSDVYLKLLSCKDEDTARRSALLAAGSKVLFGLSVAAIALAARKALPPVIPRWPCRPPSSASRRRRSRPWSSSRWSRRCRPRRTSSCSPRPPSPLATSRPPCSGRPMRLPAARLLAPLFGALGLATALALDRDVLETLKLGYSIFAAGLILPVLAALPLRCGAPRAGPGSDRRDGRRGYRGRGRAVRAGASRGTRSRARRHRRQCRGAPRGVDAGPLPGADAVTQTAQTRRSRRVAPDSRNTADRHLHGPHGSVQHGLGQQEFRPGRISPVSTARSGGLATSTK